MRIRDALTGQNLPKADLEVLLSWILGKKRSFLLAHPEQELTHTQYKAFAAALEKRRKHEPVSYITGSHDFYEYLFKSDARALIPRGSTEELVRIALEFLKNPRDRYEEVDTDVFITSKVLGKLDDVKTLIDIGTGSGVIGITLALKQPEMHVIATDVSAEALSLAQENAVLHGVNDRMEFRQGSCLGPIHDVTVPFVLISNPPYIRDGSALMHDVIDFEPHMALFGGKDGGDIPRQIWTEAQKHPFCRGVVMECMGGQLQ